MIDLPTTDKKFIGNFDAKDLGYLKKDAKPFTAISLFSGAGGAALGVSAAGFEVRVFVENDKYACDTLRRNWTRAGWNMVHETTLEYLRNPPEGKKGAWFRSKRTKKELAKEIAQHEEAIAKGPPRAGDADGWYHDHEPAILDRDITTLPTAEILEAAGLRVGEATLLEGGFPCQGFSAANSRRNSKDFSTDKRNFLYLECVRVIREALPKTFFLENVPGLVTMESGRIIRMICDDLAKSGYTINWDILDAADYGVPQRRRRVFITGDRNDVMVYTEYGSQLHIGGAAGKIKHPEWFIKKYPDREAQLTLGI